MLCIRNDYLEASFDRRTGEWRSLQTSDGLRLLGRSGPCYTLFIDGQPLPYSPFPGAARRELTDARISQDGRACEMIFEHEGFRITHCVAMDEQAAVLRQSVRIECIAGQAPRRLCGIHYHLPGLVVDEPTDCFLQTPCQGIVPDMPYTKAATIPLDRRITETLPGFYPGWLRSSPDEGPGLVVVENRSAGRVVSAWLHSEMANTFATLDGTDGLVDATFQHKLYAWLRLGDSVVSDGFCLLSTTGTLDEHLREFRRIAYTDSNIAAATLADSPDWAKDVRLFQIAPYPLHPWFDRLDELRDLGFNLIYLTPVWEGRWYVVNDHYRISASVGTADELKRFVNEAHRRGLRVIFDLIPQGIGDANRLKTEHPDWLVRDEFARPFGSHGWGPRAGAPYDGHTYSMDWGNPEYQKFIADWAAWNVTEFDIDGFRTDALHWKEPNLSPENPRPAWHTTLGGIRLAERVRAAIKAVKPDVFLLSELAGTSFLRSHEAVYEDNWLISSVTEGWLTGKPLFTARQWARYLALAKAARPDGGLRALFTATHDLLQLAVAARSSPLGNAVSFCHMLSDGIPFVMWDEITGREEFFREILALRRWLGGYCCRHDGMQWTADSLFCALWSAPGKPSRLAVANLSDQPIEESVVLPDGSSVHVALCAGGSELIPLPCGDKVHLVPALHKDRPAI